MTHWNHPNRVDVPSMRVRAAVWGSAANCRLYERDPGPAHYTEGPGGGGHDAHPDDARTVTRAEAWRDIYARSLIHELRADPALLHQAHAFSTTEYHRVRRLRYRLTLARTEWNDAPDRPTARRHALHVLTPHEYTADRDFWHLAVDLTTRAHDITHTTGADTNPYDRARLLAGIDHRFHLVFGFIPDPAANTARLTACLTEIGHAEANRRPPPL